MKPLVLLLSVGLATAAPLPAQEARLILRAGLYEGPEFTRADGYRSSELASFFVPLALTPNGFLAGQSNRYNGGSNFMGQASWVARADTGVTTRVGLFSAPEYTSSSGYQSSLINQFTASGYVGGTSTQYSGNAQIGGAAWVASAATGVTTRVGLFSGSEFTSTTGAQASGVSLIANSGVTLGYSSRYNGATDAGNASWVARADTGATTRLGLPATQEFTRNDGFVSTTADRITTSGYVGGTMQRWNGGSAASNFGQAVWVASAATGVTTRGGLTDATYTSSNGSQNSYLSNVTEQGLAWGSSARYNGAVQTGQTAWVFDIRLGVQTAFALSSRASDGASFSEIVAINDLGFALGNFELYDVAGNDLGRRVFVWSAGHGTEILDDTQGAYGFTSLQVAQALSGNFAAGTGELTGPGGGQGVFVAVVPEPGAGLLALLGLGVLAWRTRGALRG